MMIKRQFKSFASVLLFSLSMLGLTSCQTMRPTGVTLEGKAMWTVPTKDAGLLEIRVIDWVAKKQGNASVGIGSAMMVLSGRTTANFSITLDKGFYAQCLASSDCKVHLKLRDQLDLEIEGLYVLARGEAPIVATEDLIVVMEDTKPDASRNLSPAKM